MLSLYFLLVFYSQIRNGSAVLTPTHCYEFLTDATNTLDSCGSGPALAPISEIQWE